MLIDTHSHFDVDAFDADRAAALARAEAAGVRQQIVPAIDFSGWPQLQRVCAQHTGLYPAYGLHPMYLARHRPEHLAVLPAWLADGHAVAVGETGLDYFVEELDRDTQQQYFEAQLRIARELNLPVIVHARRAVDAVIATLRRFPGITGVVHSFAGSLQQAQQLEQLGFLLGIGGPVTYTRAQRLRGVVAQLPLHQLLLETDSPDQPDSTRRGARNEPAFLPTVLDTIAQLRAEDAEAIALATTANAQRMFNLPAL